MASACSLCCRLEGKKITERSVNPHHEKACLFRTRTTKRTRDLPPRPGKGFRSTAPMARARFSWTWLKVNLMSREAGRCRMLEARRRIQK